MPAGTSCVSRIVGAKTGDIPQLREKQCSSGEELLLISGGGDMLNAVSKCPYPGKCPHAVKLRTTLTPALAIALALSMSLLPPSAHAGSGAPSAQTPSSAKRVTAEDGTRIVEFEDFEESIETPLRPYGEYAPAAPQKPLSTQFSFGSS